MSKGIYKRSKKIKENLRLKMKGNKNGLGNRGNRGKKFPNRKRPISPVFSEETIQKRTDTRRKNGWYKNPERSIQKMREAQKGNNRGNDFGKANKDHKYPNRKKPGPHSEKTKNKMREWHIAHPNKIFSNTSIEQKIAIELTKRRIYFQQNVPLCKIANVDFYLPEYHIVIQCDGCFYHSCPIHNPSWFTRIEHDRKQDVILTLNDLKVYRFWQHEINKSAEECINKIKF